MECKICGNSGIEFLYGGHGNVLEQPCSYCRPSPDEVIRLRNIELSVKRLAYIVRKSVNSGPLSKDPTQEAEAWRQVRIALGEGYDERGNLLPVSASNGR